jgi:hypothetical protein
VISRTWAPDALPAIRLDRHHDSKGSGPAVWTARIADDHGPDCITGYGATETAAVIDLLRARRDQWLR